MHFLDDLLDALTVYEAESFDDRSLASVTDLMDWAQMANAKLEDHRSATVTSPKQRPSLGGCRAQPRIFRRILPACWRH